MPLPVLRPSHRGKREQASSPMSTILHKYSLVCRLGSLSRRPLDLRTQTGSLTHSCQSHQGRNNVAHCGSSGYGLPRMTEPRRGGTEFTLCRPYGARWNRQRVPPLPRWATMCRPYGTSMTGLPGPGSPTERQDSLPTTESELPLIPARNSGSPRPSRKRPSLRRNTSARRKRWHRCTPPQ